jgi:hypothetical protein
MILTLQIEVKDKVEAYKATTRLAGEFDVQSASIDGQNWIFGDRTQVKYFLKENYINQETKQEVNIVAERLITKKII